MTEAVAPASRGELDEDVHALIEALRKRAERMDERKEADLESEDRCACEECAYEESERDGYAAALRDVASELEAVLGWHTSSGD
ncbi:hypothetical protein [Kineococcus esterisolvens]|uniref:hypothetical protein n=1 Tax=unclassified Kineococcus TaxID=2621656 RepID=UPI003D7D481D